MGRYGNEEEAAYAYNDAIREAGLEGVRKVNPVVDGCVEIKPVRRVHPTILHEVISRRRRGPDD